MNDEWFEDEEWLPIPGFSNYDLSNFDPRNLKEI